MVENAGQTPSLKDQILRKEVAVFKCTFLLYVLEPDFEIHTYVALCDIPSLKRKRKSGHLISEQLHHLKVRI